LRPKALAASAILAFWGLAKRKRPGIWERRAVYLGFIEFDEFSFIGVQQSGQKQQK
jgi:hypothetical protein